MFKINRKIEYALIALRHMSRKQPGQLTSAKEICDIYFTPFDPTARVLQIMTQEGVLQAVQGAHGGYLIVKDIAKISLQELSSWIVGPIEITNCFHGDSSHCGVTANCNIISPMLNLNQRLNKLFSEIVITDLIDSKHQAEKNIRGKPVVV